MKSFLLSILFLSFLQTSFAQKYEYNILGEHFKDTLYSSKIPTIKNSVVTTGRRVLFEIPHDTTYIYHKVGEGENVEYILNLYQICAPCFAEWNHLDYPSSMPFFEQVMTQRLYEGEYLKVALKKDYENGISATFKTRTVYVNFERRTSVNDEILRKYNISREKFLEWNSFLDKRVFHVKDITLIVGKIEYKYACPCLE